MVTLWSPYDFPTNIDTCEYKCENRKAFDRIAAEEEKLIDDEKILKNTGFFGMIVSRVGSTRLKYGLCLCDGFFANRNRLYSRLNIFRPSIWTSWRYYSAVMNQAVYGKTDMTDFNCDGNGPCSLRKSWSSSILPYHDYLVDDTKKYFVTKNCPSFTLWVVGGSYIDWTQTSWKYTKTIQRLLQWSVKNGWALSILRLRILRTFW